MNELSSRLQFSMNGKTDVTGAFVYNYLLR